MLLKGLRIQVRMQGQYVFRFFPFKALALRFCVWVSQMVVTIVSSQSLLNRPPFVFLVQHA